MEFLQQILGEDVGAALLIIFNLILIESLLSVDNAAVLATMVLDLPQHQRGKALQYGILGAYVFRGLCLFFAAWIIQIWWLKPLGGLYLLYLTYSYFQSKATPKTEDDTLNKQENRIYKYTLGFLGPFWATIALVEFMDLAFSIDNVFAAVAYVENVPAPYNLRLVWIGVFIGILAMRFVAVSFVKLMERFPFLETSAFIVIGILGVKLTASLICHFYPAAGICEVLEGEGADLFVSLFTFAVFFVPVLTSLFFNYPNRNAKSE